MELSGLTIHALHAKLVSHEITATVLTEAVLTRLAAVEERVHAYITVTPELARQQQTRRLHAGRFVHPCKGSRWPSRTISAPKGYGPPVPRVSWPILCHHTM